MANDISASFPEYWSRRMNRKHEKHDVYRAVANFEEQMTLRKGDVVHRPYRSSVTVNDIGTSGAYTRQELTDGDEYLTVDQKKEATFYLEDYWALQSSYRTANLYADDTAVQLGNQIDGQVFGEYDQADSDIGAYEIAGTGSLGDGLGVTLTTSNVLKVFTKAGAKLDALNISLQDRWAVISPQFKEILLQYLAGKESALGDSTGKNGHIGRYMGFELYESNALGWSGHLVLATIPTENDTITINGVAWRWKATIAAANDIDIGASIAISCDNLVAAINDTESLAASTEGTLYWGPTAANRNLTKNIVAADGTDSASVTFKATGRSYVIVSETLTAAADIWTTTKQIQHVLFGQGKPIDVVVQKYPKLEIFHRDGYIGRDFVTWILFGIKTFDEGDAQLVDVLVRSDAF